MKKIFFIGPKEYCNAMRLIGFQCLPAGNKEEASLIAEEIQDDALILVSQDLSLEKKEVVNLPGLVQKTDPEHLKQETRKAIGGDIMLN